MSMRISSTSLAISPGLTLLGRSRAGDGTSFVIPELRWWFDCGALVHGADSLHLFLTHTHADHITFLGHVLLNKERPPANPPSVYVYTQALPFVESYLKAHQTLTEMQEHHLPPLSDYVKLRPVEPGREFRIQRAGDDYLVTPILADHRIPCLGYSIVKRRKRLTDNYRHLPGHEIGKLRKQGVTGLFEHVQDPVLCYVGDSTHRVWEQHLELLQQHHTVVTECSFLYDRDVARAKETKHTHWKHLKPIVEAHPDTLFVLIHFSLKHSTLSLRQFFNDYNANSKMANVHPMLVEHEIANEWKKTKRDEETPPKCNCFRCCPNETTTTNEPNECTQTEEVGG